ncbi:MAG: hypothetical protein J6C91_01290 [Muribaculaceae bacterium]|nr:hypothetical protein [Muribaculaceae bacterium]
MLLHNQQELATFEQKSIMSYPESQGIRPPWWFLVITVISALPALRLPALISSAEGEAKVILWLYPLMLLLGCWCAWRCYTLERKTMAWILVAICWLMTVSINLIITAS